MTTKGFLFRRFFAYLLILSLTLSQAFPAGASPELGRRTLRPGIEGKSQAGLEEQLGGGATTPVAAIIGHTSVLVEPKRKKDISNRTLTAQDRTLLGELDQFLASLPERQANLQDQVLAGMKFLKDRSKELARRLPSKQEVEAQLEAVIGASPVACVTCGADAIANLTSDPQFRRPEEEQSDEFNSRERQTAILILHQLVRTGGFSYVERQHGGMTHRMLADSLLDIQTRLETVQKGASAGSRIRWEGVAAREEDLGSLTQAGHFIAHLDESHFVVVKEATPEAVTFTEPAFGEEGVLGTAEVTVSRREFMSRWIGGRGLVGVRTDGALPRGVRVLSASHLAGVIGCCGVVSVPSSLASSELEKGAFFGIRPDSSPYEAAYRAIELLEPRGFDAAALLIKYEMPLADLVREILPLSVTLELRRWARAKRVKLVESPEGHLKSIRFFAVSRVVGGVTANQQGMKREDASRVKDVVSGFFQAIGRGELQAEAKQESPVSSDWIVTTQKGRRDHPLARISARGVYFHTRFATKGGFQLANAHHWEVDLEDILPVLASLLGIDDGRQIDQLLEEGWENGVFSLSHNGDWETYDWVRAYLDSKGVKIQGTTDSEVLLMLLVLMSLTQNDGGHFSVEPSEVALRRLFRLIDVLEVFKALGKQLGEVNERVHSLRQALLKATADQKAKIERKIYDYRNEIRQMRLLLAKHGFLFTADELLASKQMGGKKFQEMVSEAFVQVLERAISDPSYYDQRGTEENKWHGYLTFDLHNGEPIDPHPETKQPQPTGFGAFLSKASPLDFRDVFWKGLNITIQVSSLNDPYGGVVARAHSQTQTTQVNLVVERDSQGEIARVVAVSELRGAAPQMGRVKERYPTSLPGINVVYGTAEGKFVEPWTIYTVDGTQVNRYKTWENGSETVNLAQEVSTLDAAWIEVLKEGEETYRKLSPYELETLVQHATYLRTFDRYVRRDEYDLLEPHLEVGEDGTGLTPGMLKLLSDPEAQIVVVGAGSGTSTFILEIADAEEPLFDTIRQSDSLRLRLTPNLTFGEKTILLVVSQSGETGSALNLIATALPSGAKVIGVTNTAGSAVDRFARVSGGTLRTRSTPESSVPATGTANHAILLLRILGIERWRRQALAAAQSSLDAPRINLEAHQRLEKLRAHGSRMEDGSLQAGTLAAVLDSSFQGKVLPWEKPVSEKGGAKLKSYRDRFSDVESYWRDNSRRSWTSHHAGYGVDFRPVNVTFIERGKGKTVSELGLKFAEVVGVTATVLRSSSEFLERDIAASNGRTNEQYQSQKELWDPSTVTETVRANRRHFADALNHARLTREPIQKILLVGNGTDTYAMQLVRNSYQHLCPASIEVMTYEEALARRGGRYSLPRGTLVVFVRPGEAMIYGRDPNDKGHETEQRKAADLIARWNIAPDQQICLHSSETTPLVQEIRPRLSNLLELQGRPYDQGFAVFSALDRLVAQLALRSIDEGTNLTETWKEEARSHIKQEQTSREAAASTGIQRTIDETSDSGYNSEAINRIAGFAEKRSQDRGWEGFNIWPGGYGAREWLARDFARWIREYLGMVSYPEEPSNFGHGGFAAQQPGGELVVWYGNVGPSEKAAYDPDMKKRTTEMIPRAVNPPFPTDREPGFFLYVGTEGDLKDLSIPDGHFQAFRHGRKQSLENIPLTLHKTIGVTHSDAVIATPNGDLLELLVLNRLVVNQLVGRRVELLKRAGIPWDVDRQEMGQVRRARRGELVVVYDSGAEGPDRAVFYKELRKRFPRWETTVMVLISKKEAESLYQMGGDVPDHVIALPTGDPVEAIAAIHGFTSFLAKKRFQPLAEWAAKVARAIWKELEDPAGTRGVFGQFDDPQDPQFLDEVVIIRAYAALNKKDDDGLSEKDRILKQQITGAISALESKYSPEATPKEARLRIGEVYQLLQEALEIYRINLPMVFGFAHDPDQLIRVLTYQQQGVTKIVTNLAGLEEDRPTTSASYFFVSPATSVQSPPPSQAGLEEQFLTWAKEVEAFDPIAAIRQDRETSEFLASVRAVNLAPDQAGAWKAAESLRGLSEEEQALLERQGNFAVNSSGKIGSWDDVFIDAAMSSDQVKAFLSRILGNRFFERVEIGRIEPREITLPDGITRKLRGIFSSEIRNSRLGKNMAIDSSEITNYVLKGDNIVVKARMAADPETTFGLSQYHEIRNEAGVRKLPVHPELILKGALHLSSRLLTDKRFADQYRAEHAEYVKLARSKWGIVEEGSVIDTTSQVINVYVGKNTFLDHAQHVKEAVLIGGFTSAEMEELLRLARSEQETPRLLVELTGAKLAQLRQGGEEAVRQHVRKQKVVVDNAAQLNFVVMKPQAHAATASQLTQMFLDEAATAEQGVNVTGMYLGPDGLVAKGEFGGDLGEDFVTSHHKTSLVLGGHLPYGFNVGAGIITANHDGSGAELELKLPKGGFGGSGVVFQLPADFSGSDHALFQTGILVSSGQTVTFPFMLMGVPDPDSMTKLGAKQRLYNEVAPGWVLTYLPYMLLRNEWKWSARKKSLRSTYRGEIYAPETAIHVKEALTHLEDIVDPERTLYMGEKDGGKRPSPQGVTGLGNNYLHKDNRIRGIEAYRQFLRQYSAQGLFRELDRLEKAGSLNAESVQALLKGPAQNRRWEHERQTLFENHEGKRVSEILAAYRDQSRATRELIKTRIDERVAKVVATLGLEGKELLDDSARNKFVVEILGPKTQFIETRVSQLTAALTSSGADLPLTAAGLETTEGEQGEVYEKILEFAARNPRAEVTTQGVPSPWYVSPEEVRDRPWKVRDLLGGAGSVPGNVGGRVKATFTPTRIIVEPARAGLEEIGQAETEEQVRGRILQQAKDWDRAEFGAQKLSFFTHPQNSRERNRFIRESLEKEFGQLGEAEKRSALRFLADATFLMASEGIQERTLRNKELFGADVLTPEVIQAEVQEWHALLNRLEALAKPLAQQVLADWRQDLLQIQLANVEKDFDAKTNKGQSFLAYWAEKAPTGSLSEFVTYFNEKIQKARLRRTVRLTGQVLGNDYGAGIDMLTDYYTFVMLNPTLSRRNVRERRSLQLKVKEAVFNFVRSNPGYDPKQRKWALLREATMVAGEPARRALLPIFIHEKGMRGQVSFQVNSRLSKRHEVVADIFLLGDRFAAETQAMMKELGVTEIFPKQQLDAFLENPLGNGYSKVHPVFKVDGTLAGVYGRVLEAWNEALTQAGDDLDQVDPTQINTESIIEDVHTQGLFTNITGQGSVAGAVAGFMAQVTANMKARTQKIPIHAAYITQMAGRVEAALRWVAIDRVRRALQAREDQDPKAAELLAKLEKEIKEGALKNPDSNGLMDNLVLREAAAYVSFRLSSDKAVRRAGAAIIQQTERILNALRTRLASNGVTPEETGQLLASTRLTVPDDTMSHFFQTSGRNIRIGFFPIAARGVEEGDQPDVPNGVTQTQFDAHIQAIEKNPAVLDGVFQEVEPELIQELIDSSIGDEFRRFYEVNDGEKELLTRLGIYQSEWSGQGWKLSELRQTAFARHTETGDWGMEIKDDDEAWLDRVKQQFMGDTNLWGRELEVLARLIEVDARQDAKSAAKALFAPLFEGENNPDQALETAVDNYLTNKPSPVIKKSVADLTLEPEFLPFKQNFDQARQAAAAGLEERTEGAAPTAVPPVRTLGTTPLVTATTVLNPVTRTIGVSRTSGIPLVRVPSAVDAHKGLILAHEALAFLEMVPSIEPVDGQQVPIVAIVENGDHLRKVKARAEQLGLQITLIDASVSYGGNVMLAARETKKRLSAEGFSYQLALFLSDLMEVVKFLGVPIPESFIQAAEGVLKEQVSQYL